MILAYERKVRKDSMEKKKQHSEKGRIYFSEQDELKILKSILFILPFFYGLFYEFTACLAGVVLLLFLILLILNRKTFYFCKTWALGLLMFFCLCYLLTCIWAVDRGMALIGFIKISPCMIMQVIFMQFNREEIRSCFDIIPRAGVVMVTFSLLGYVITPLQQWFIDGGRLGSFFQYANTFALFLLMGIVIMGFKNNRNPRNLIMMAILILGVFLTGSRTGFIILVALLILLAIKFKNIRIPILCFGGFAIVSILLYVYVSNDAGGIGRFTKLFTQSSELWGRFLYWKDAIGVLIKNPFGLGNLGYFYLQPQIQTGVYTTRYVHNMLLQIGLDAGIVALAIFIYLMVRTFISKQRNFLEKTLLAIIVVHSLIDFDLEYLYIWVLLLMFMDIGEATVFSSDSKLKVRSTVGCSILIIGYLYFTFGFYLGHMGSYDIALKMIPFDTDLKTNAILTAESEDEIIDWSKNILESNDSIALAYEGMVLEAQQNHDYKEMVTYKQASIKRAKYDKKRYEEYLKILEETMNYYNKQGDIEQVRYYANMAMDIPNMLNKVASETDTIAYYIKDKPELNLSETAYRYLVQLEKVLN